MSISKYVRTPYKYLLFVPEDKEFIVRKYVELSSQTESKAAVRLISFIEEDLKNLETSQVNEKLVCEICKKEFKEGALARFVSGVKMLVCASCFKVRYDKGLVRGILKEFKE